MEGRGWGRGGTLHHVYAAAGAGAPGGLDCDAGFIQSESSLLVTCRPSLPHPWLICCIEEEEEEEEVEVLLHQLEALLLYPPPFPFPLNGVAKLQSNAKTFAFRESGFQGILHPLVNNDARQEGFGKGDRENSLGYSPVLPKSPSC